MASPEITGFVLGVTLYLIFWFIYRQIRSRAMVLEIKRQMALEEENKYREESMKLLTEQDREWFATWDKILDIPQKPLEDTSAAENHVPRNTQQLPGPYVCQCGHRVSGHSGTGRCEQPSCTCRGYICSVPEPSTNTAPDSEVKNAAQAAAWASIDERRKLIAAGKELPEPEADNPGPPTEAKSELIRNAIMNLAWGTRGMYRKETFEEIGAGQAAVMRENGKLGTPWGLVYHRVDKPGYFEVWTHFNSSFEASTLRRCIPAEVSALVAQAGFSIRRATGEAVQGKIPAPEAGSILRGEKSFAPCIIFSEIQNIREKNPDVNQELWAIEYQLELLERQRDIAIQNQTPPPYIAQQWFI